jgi:hypothetical protein
MKDFEVFIWAADYEDFTGEGLLARLFVKNSFNLSKKKIKIYSNNNRYYLYDKKLQIVEKKLYKNTFIQKYIYPLYGIFLIWYFYLQGKKVCYVNYLPLWAFWIFLLLPKKTILGPITGGTHKKNIYSVNNLIRRFVITFFYFLTLKFIFLKYKKIIFSTDNLKSFIPKSKIKFCFFNFCLLFYKKRKNKKKTIDFLFYLRLHNNKSNDVHIRIIDSLLELNFKIIVVGDKYIRPNLINYINIPRKKLLTFLDETKFTIVSDENFYSLFAIDCFSSNVHVFYNQTVKPNKFYFSEKLISSIKFSNINFSLNKILKIVKNRKNKNNHIKNKKIKSENFLYLNNLKKDFLDRSAKF